MEGYVNVLVNKRGQVRISRTTKEPRTRAKEISRNKGEKFEVAHWVYVSDCKAVKSMVCSQLAKHRWGKTDMFMVNVESAIRVVNSCADDYEARINSYEDDYDDEDDEDDEDDGDASCLFIILLLIPLSMMIYGLITEFGL